MLLSNGRWQPDQVRSLATESFRVLRHLRDPLTNGRFSGRGLVVGYVQSGKTANYTAVAARAVDAGYRLIVVLSGIHDALRDQTQARLERELVGLSGECEDPLDWTLLTGREADFEGTDPAILCRNGAFLAVIKKNTHILRKLIEFLESAGALVENLPALIIDDEADQASINTKGNRTPDPALDDEEDASDQASAPSPTNRLIRTLLGLLPRVSYIAYTATPFANIFINPQALDREVGEDLFPRDFALQLPRPEGYTGTEELFGVSAQGRDVLRPVPDDDVGLLRSSRRRPSAGIKVGPAEALIPTSLSDAFLTFCLAGAIRELRPGFADQPHTMLVHVSSRTADQARIANALKDQREIWQEALQQRQRLDDLFAGILRNHLAGVELPGEEEEIVARACRVMAGLEILELNSVAGENLEYDRHPARHLVVVGGNRLSRGLTLEGLTVSYFLRTTNMADTLLQMARWYGFRTGYEDLIRIWTTDGIAHWFTELALVEQSLRDSLRALARAGRRPDEMAIRLRAHSGLLLTARNKSGLSTEVQDSWSGEHPQTVILPLATPDRLAENRLLTERLVSSIGGGRQVSGGWLLQDVPPEIICEYLRLYRTHDDVVAFRGHELADWITGRVEAGELLYWSVFIAGSHEGAITKVGGLPTGVVTRSRTSSESIGILIDPRHEGVDLPSGPEAYRRRNGNYDAEAMRAARPSTQGLLILYPLDPGPLGINGTDAVIAVALSLPRTSDGAHTSIVNRGVPDGRGA
ncbi:Z1 domain-containing protein [Inquilinus limosus]|uniref:Z1 domain-containing protein n=1 Tax=Inquilinus limosus TaxID=171674 RepID=UPI001B7F8F72|nr:Z1 domain-containing protein [Inquilinus limosus]